MVAETALPAPDVGAGIEGSRRAFEADILNEIIGKVVHLRDCAAAQAPWDEKTETGQKPVDGQDSADRGHHVCPTLHTMLLFRCLKNACGCS